MSAFRFRRLALAVAAVFASGGAHATNGMNLEAYGPIAGGMGGAAFAYDNGTAAVANNPATLGLMTEGQRLDVALGFLGPDIQARMSGMPAADSSATAFYMPAVGWARRAGQVTFGVGVFGQGGMGTEYAGDSFLAAGSGKTVRSEVGVGRLILPFNLVLGERLVVGGSLDYVWAGMDLRMAMSGAQFGDMVGALGGRQTYGTASGSMVTGMVGMIGAGMLDPTGPVNWTRFDFSNGNAFTGAAFGDGFAAKLGMVFRVNERLTVGATYHAQTALSDLSADEATVSMSVEMDDNLLNGSWDPAGGTGGPAGTYSTVQVPVTGRIAVQDFQWPETIGLGVALRAHERVMLAADVKRIAWSDVMERFQMRFEADASQSNPLAQGFAGGTMEASLWQRWKDQTVFALGASVQANDRLVLRAGLNVASNPVPDKYMNPLFPATVERHYTVGAGYTLGEAGMLNASLSYVPEVEDVNGAGITVTHAQTNWQLRYSLRF